MKKLLQIILIIILIIIIVICIAYAIGMLPQLITFLESFSPYLSSMASWFGTFFAGSAWYTPLLVALGSAIAIDPNAASAVTDAVGNVAQGVGNIAGSLGDAVGTILSNIPAGFWIAGGLFLYWYLSKGREKTTLVIPPGKDGGDPPLPSQPAGVEP